MPTLSSQQWKKAVKSGSFILPYNLEEQQRQNERDLKELQHYQKEIDTYLGKKHENI